MIQAIIFDCFGVLYTDSKESLRSSVSSEKVAELNDVYKRNDYGYTTRQEFLKAVSETTGLSIDAINETIAREHNLNTELVTLISEQLKPHYKIGMLSNIGREWIDDFFSKHQLHELFDEVVLSGEEGMTKPHPEIFELMASRLGLPTESCLMIDDIKENCEGAERVGMQAIFYQNSAQLLDSLYERKILR